MGSYFFSRSPRIKAGNYEQLTSFTNLYKPCDICGGFHYSDKLDDSSDNKQLERADKIAKLIYEGNFNEKIDPDLAAMVGGKLKDGLIKGFGKDFVNIKYNTPDWNMLSNLEKNVYQFAAAKNYQQLKDITLALKDDKGNVRSFKEFREIANKISYQYTNWLKTEYNTAIAGGQMAGRWVDFESRSDSMPFLQYVTAGDYRVREEHAVLDGVIKQIDDPFWDIYYPPNGYNCRCDVIQLPYQSESTNTNNIATPDVIPMFKTNLAKNGLAFPEGHPYFNIPTNYKAKTTDEWKLIKGINEWNSVDKKEYKKSYLNTQNGGYYIAHKQHTFDKKRGFYEKEASKILANNGNYIKLESEKPTGYKIKHAEGFLNNVLFDIKTVEGAGIGSIKRKLDDAALKKVQHVIFYFPDPKQYSEERIINGFRDYSAKNNYSFSKIWVVTNNKINVFK